MIEKQDLEDIDLKNARAIFSDDEGNMYIYYEKNEPVTTVRTSENGIQKGEIEFDEFKDLRFELQRTIGSTGLD